MSKKYKNYLYYKGEESNPFDDFGKAFWWDLEHYAFENSDEKPKNDLSVTMVHYIKEKMMDGGNLPTITNEEAMRRASEMYRRGIWNAACVCNRERPIEDE